MSNIIVAILPGLIEYDRTTEWGGYFKCRAEGKRANQLALAQKVNARLIKKETRLFN